MSKSALLIQIASENQANLLKQINIIAQQPVTVEQQRTMNHSRGTVYSERMSRNTETEILDILRNQCVSKVEIYPDIQPYKISIPNQTSRLAPRDCRGMYFNTSSMRPMSTTRAHKKIIATVTRTRAPNVVTLATKQSPAPKNLSASTVEGPHPPTDR